ncbi:ABC transporter substrate-binding protein [Clostridium sp. chh4-2]|uniref:ABC transporter substrate-binding protein n=1 Tax=Clostridium sp. chh4-2 TaxID=2067550 RepID=UPI000CCFB77A|nr:extracellular solute-binding protein [Clostridium sp. chh4-2]PNV60624.1 ABC transporter substrate-binding protein [Clostridium sp. chh4-2]
MKKTMKRALSILLASTMAFGAMGCSKKQEQVVIYSNADDEAVDAMKKALDENGYKDKYIFQTFGTSELGGKILAEGNNLEADMITMSSYYIDSAQSQNQMFLDLTFDHKTLGEYPSFYTPITAQEGAIIVNTELIKSENLPMPACIKDLADPVYEGMISVTDISSSSTAWLLIQAVISAYGEEEGKQVLSQIFKNAGPHIESSGSGPIKKVRAGEVAVGFGLRHQAAADKASGLPIDFVDPREGNFSLTESIAVIDKKDKTNPLAMEMAQCIIQKGRTDLLKTYPLPVYEGETADDSAKSAYPKVFPEPLTVDLLKKHTDFSNSCK